MQVKFEITLEDGSVISSHDKDWNLRLDHAHALPPNSSKVWHKYRLKGDDPGTPDVEVDFTNGTFTINGYPFQPGDDSGNSFTHDLTPQKFPVSEQWEMLNGLPYFPVVGRRIFKGELYGTPIDATVYFCGWKRKVGDKTIQKVAYIYPNGVLVFS